MRMRRILRLLTLCMTVALWVAQVAGAASTDVGSPSLHLAQVFGARPGPVRVCFYRRTGYAGESWCAGQGLVDAITRPGWDNAISSLRVLGGLVRVCKQPALIDCKIVSRDRPQLGEFENVISSFIVIVGDSRAR